MHLPSGTLLPAMIAPATVVCFACTAPAPKPDFRSSQSSARIKAIVANTDADDPASERALVEQLDSADPAVRLLAITSLERRTGETHDYDHAALRREREAAMQVWVDAVSAEDHP